MLKAGDTNNDGYGDFIMLWRNRFINDRQNYKYLLYLGGPVISADSLARIDVTYDFGIEQDALPSNGTFGNFLGDNCSEFVRGNHCGYGLHAMGVGDTRSEYNQTEFIYGIWSWIYEQYGYVTDLNFDGWDDLLCGSPTSSSVDIIMGGHNTNFDYEQRAAWPNTNDSSFGVAVTAGDFNGNGVVDMAVGASSTMVFYPEIGIYRDNGQVFVYEMPTAMCDQQISPTIDDTSPRLPANRA